MIHLAHGDVINIVRRHIGRVTTRSPKPDLNNTKVAKLAQHHSQLVERVAQSQDWDAFQELFLYFGPRVKAMMLKAGADNAQAEDLVQDTMTKVWRKAATYAVKRGAVSTWIFTIARNARIDRIRKASSQPYDDIDDVELAADEPSGDEHIYASQRATLVADAVRELPPEQRKVIELAFLHDLPQREIATKLAVPLGTVKSRMRLAYAKLSLKLGDFK